MKRLALLLVLLAMSLPGSSRLASAVAQPASSPTPEAVSEPVSVGDWTFQVVQLERRDSYYGEHFAEVYQPRGVFLILGVAITYNGSSTEQLDLFTGGFFQLTTSSGDVYDQASDVFSAFGIEESFRTAEYPYPPLALNGVAEPGVTLFTRFIYDVPADATGLAFASGPLAPGEFAIPLPDPKDIAGPDEWALEVLDATLYQALGPPLTGGNRYEPGGLYLVVDVRLTRLQETRAAIDASWFALRTANGDTIPVAPDETIALGIPVDAGGGETVEFALVFDVPPALDGPTLITTPGAPLSVEIPLNPGIAPTPAPTPSPTPLPTTAPTATTAPTVAPTATTVPTPVPTVVPTVVPTAVPTVVPTTIPTAIPTTVPTPVPTATIAPTAVPSAEPTVSSEPGAIRVVTAGGGAATTATASGAVELILDTSGSMLQPMGDGLRIDVAKGVLTDVVTTQLPAGTQTAMRVFGTVPGSCETTLAIPLGPLDPATAASTIAGIGAINEVRTPLGASLQAAGTDLAVVDGPKLIVLITDGEETCGGDPGAAINALVAQGIDIRVNIVGFAIDDPAVEATLAAWAEQGGGRYFAAADAGDLGPALSQALQPPFEVQDSDGVTVGSGIVNGEPVPVPAGQYTVVVDTASPTSIEGVVVKPGETTEVTIGDGG